MAGAAGKGKSHTSEKSTLKKEATALSSGTSDTQSWCSSPRKLTAVQHAVLVQDSLCGEPIITLNCVLPLEPFWTWRSWASGPRWLCELMKRGEEKPKGRGEPAHSGLREAQGEGEGWGAKAIIIAQTQPPFLKNKGWGRNVCA